MTRIFPPELHLQSLHFHKLNFHKLQGAGNDFVVLDLFSRPLAPDFDFSAAAVLLCNRHFGAGADGLLTLEPATDRSPLRMRMWNPDGSEDMCGNGLRCVAALAWRQKIIKTPRFEVQTLAGTRQIEILKTDWIRAAMGEPVFEPSQIPIVLPATKNEALDIEIPVGGRVFRASSLSTGSTHTVIFLDSPLSEADFQKFGPLLENHPFFPSRTSIMFAVADGENRFKIRIWERGAGETLACGTGACAVAVAAQMVGRARGPIEVESRGGTLKVEWNRGEPIFLTGPARHVFEAESDFVFETSNAAI
ncbi:diaminopimelate epimerase [Abditibacterium utsteinense]|uniref:Diaminopimelate epimerase n=1 Tax=Abditibacterium utsteinense TaxID=1960156 RepID=A0A2S8SPK7_9BACT|nr:diaminopimelate epimerase [Abditibacterium utsteinense]PQV62735.1 diaminopimelate epimerase [Abditibacterium utsteinense]